MTFRRFLNHRLSVAQVILILGGFVYSFTLLGNGSVLRALAVMAIVALVLSGIAFLKRRRPVRAIRLEETTLLPHACETVWGLIEPAVYSPLLEPKIAYGYRVPGTPHGVGERHALEEHNGVTTIVEVVEHEPNRRAVSRQVSPRSIVEIRSFDTVEPTDGGCRYSVAVEVDMRAGVRLRSDFERQWRREMKDRFARTRAILDSGEPIVAPTRDAPPTATGQP